MTEAETMANEMYRDEYTRLIRVEEQVAQIRTVARLAWSLVIVMVLQLGGFIYAYAQLDQKVEAMNLGGFQTDISTALVVLANHDTEIQDVRDEHARLRGQMDEMWKAQREYQAKLDDKTKDRFYKSDGDRLEGRVSRLEDRAYKQ